MIILKFVFTLLILHVQSISCQSEVDENAPSPKEYVIVVDGGSSGTRLHVFRFIIGDGYAQLVNTSRFTSNTPFSQFSKDRENWSLLRIMLNELIREAMNVIPEQYVNETHIYVQVTAGVRQLETRIGKRILNHIRNVLHKSKLFFQGKFVNILSTKDEGLFDWISVNYLLDQLVPITLGDRKLVGTLDLGRGSTHISFANTHPEIMRESVQVQLFGQEYNVYAAGYDDMGIDEIRLKYLGAENCVDETCDNETKLSSCLPLNVTRYFNFGNRTLTVKGKEREFRSLYCFNLGNVMIDKAQRIEQYYPVMEFVGISDFYYIAKGAGATVRKIENGLYETNVIHYFDRAIQICGNPNLYYQGGAFDHFLCIDTSYVAVLIYMGYGITRTAKMSVGLKIKGTHISWALGYAISKFRIAN